ncbi:endopeptidase, partial [Streptococcus suis]|nr:endopeptidase [Streptococcus suis]
GFSDEEIKDLLDKRLELDATIAKYVLSNEEGSEYAKLYHPYEWADFTALTPELPLDDFFTAILGQTPDKIIVPEERFWQAAKDIYSADNWELLKA